MKAVLVIDIDANELPKDAYANVYVFGKYGEQEDDFVACIGDVPLKQMPDCPDVPDTIANDVAYIIGWNDCIVEISKERKEAKSLIKNEKESVSNRGER